MKTKVGLLFLSAFVFFFIVRSAWAVSPDYSNMGQVLAANRASLLYIDASVVNLRGPSAEEDKNGLRAKFEAIYKRAIEHDFYANLWYLQGNYSKTYQELRLSQQAMSELYGKLLLNYIDETVVLLEASAPIIVITKDQSALKLIQIGFRDLESTRQTYVRGSNGNPAMTANQINYFTDGIQRIRRARRFGILSLLEAKVPIPEKTKYQLVSLDDVRNAADEDEKQTRYQEILNLLINMTGRKLVPLEVTSDVSGTPITLNVLEIHQDNYHRVYSERRSAFAKLSLDLKTHEFHATDILPNRNRDNRYEVPASNSDPIKPTQSTPTVSKQEPAKEPEKQPEKQPAKEETKEPVK